jgi:hypothetical protein
MRCGLPGCDNHVTRRHNGKPTIYCSETCSHAARQCNFNGEPTGRHSVYRQLDRSERDAFRRWLKDGGRLTP